MKTIELADVFKPFGIVGGRGVTVTNDGNGNVTITAKSPWPDKNIQYIPASAADLDMRDRFGTRDGQWLSAGVICDSGPSGTVADNCNLPTAAVFECEACGKETDGVPAIDNKFRTVCYDCRGVIDIEPDEPIIHVK